MVLSSILNTGFWERFHCNRKVFKVFNCLLRVVTRSHLCPARGHVWLLLLYLRSFVFYLWSLMVTRALLVVTRALLVVTSVILVVSRFLLCGHSRSTCSHWWSLVLYSLVIICGQSRSFVVTRGHVCGEL